MTENETTTELDRTCGNCPNKIYNFPDSQVLNCGHFRCGLCYQFNRSFDGSYECGKCDKVTPAAELKNLLYVHNLLKEVKQLKKTLEEKEKTYEKMAEMMEQNRKDRSGDVICMECGKVDNESDVQVCEGCSKPSIELLRNHLSNGLDVNSIAICSTCAIRNHMKKGHEVTDFLPIALSHQSNVNIQMLEPKRSIYRKDAAELEKGMEVMMNVVKETEKGLDRMTDMMRRSKTRYFQQKFATKIASQIDTNHEYIDKLRKHIGQVENDMNTMLKNLEAENTSEEKINCFENIEKNGS